MSTLRDRSPKGAGKSPYFKIRIPSELKQQCDEVAASQGISLGLWFKELARNELKRMGIEPKA
ncbi:toxin-antitoxin system HicB family antitoxin [Salmonella enterica subsp. enterica serovar Enteritidis]|uniref:Toxin-antitoxin system HicB family antitoxin n=1 Tax=Salmonella enterica TaxID=28901 RepID=A0A743P158_SALER|nr:toxin-antitoxin system HicB family antitoxin [Salmonella enterica subsp. enterica serovar Enteritidis]EEP9436170.1 toxin-antitoxin system HicB family antitoxin [Salmonella enterica subsp. enterica serovar Reading]HAF2127433.1 toxin-antitoxin system HicB family antitoxin [Salmonella enterica]